MTAGLTRLKRRADFLRISGRGRKRVTPGFLVQADRTPTGAFAEGEGPAMRVGFTVSRKVGKAVVRNRAKRRLRAIARDVLARQGRPGYDYVLVGRRNMASLPYGDLVTDLEAALSRLHAGGSAARGSD